jgi:hypothetical protein
MNYKDLLTKLQAIEEGHTPPIAPTHTDGPAEEEMMGISLPMPGMIGHEEAPKQSDNVSMNVSLNGQGAGGVRDLMNILHNIEKGATGAEHDDIVFGEPGEQHEKHPHIGDDEMEETMGDNGQTFGNSVHGDHGTHVHGIDAVTATGDDLASKGKASPLQRAPGVNPLRRPMEEGLVEKLQNLYNEVKTRDLNENVLTDETGHTMQHILHTHQRDVRDFEAGGDMSDSLYDALYDYYFDDMPYGVKKARDGDPYEWISDRFAADLGISENLQMNQAQGAGAGD